MRILIPNAQIPKPKNQKGTKTPTSRSLQRIYPDLTGLEKNDMAAYHGTSGGSEVPRWCRVRLPVNGSVGIWVLGGLRYVGAW